MSIPRNDFAREGRSILDDPDAWRDEKIAHQDVQQERPEPKVSGRFFAEPHRAIASSSCPVCGASAGLPCSGSDIPEPQYYVHFAREKNHLGDQDNA